MQTVTVVTRQSPRRHPVSLAIQIDGMLIGLVNFLRGAFLGDQFVSVVLPTFNRAATLPNAIASVLDQTHRHLEVTVVDDGSTDNTAEIVGAIDDKRLRYVRLAANRGQAAARNVGLRSSRASLVAFQDSDDFWHPHKLEMQLRWLDRHPGAAGVYCDLDRRFLAGHSCIIEAPALEVGRYLDERPSLYQTYGLGIQSCVLQKQALVEAGGFRERLKTLEDLELLLRIAYRHRLHRLPEALVDYHESETSVCKNPENERRARIFLLFRYGLWGAARYPANVAAELARCLASPRPGTQKRLPFLPRLWSNLRKQ